MRRAARRIVLEALGWILVVVGLAALVLPGPGLLALFAGMALLAVHYEWARRRVEPVRRAALRTAADSVRTWTRIVVSCLCCLVLAGVGVVFGLRPDAPRWWPVDDRWWLPGGWGTGATMIGSAVFAAALLVYSFRNFRAVERERREPTDRVGSD